MRVFPVNLITVEKYEKKERDKKLRRLNAIEEYTGSVFAEMLHEIRNIKLLKKRSMESDVEKLEASKSIYAVLVLKSKDKEVRDLESIEFDLLNANLVYFTKSQANMLPIDFI